MPSWETLLPHATVATLSRGDLTWLDHLVTVLFGLVIPLIAAFRTQPTIEGQRFSRSGRLATLWTNAALLLAMSGLVLCAWWFAGRPLHLLGLGSAGPGQWIESLWISTPFLALYLLELRRRVWGARALRRARERFDRYTPFLPHSWGEFSHSLVLCLAAGVGEEMVYRGHLLRYGVALFGASTGSLVAVVALPAVIFALAHRYQGTRAILQVFVLAVCFSLAFLRTGTLWPLIVMHTLIDVLGMALGVWLVRRTGGEFAEFAETTEQPAG